MPTGAVGTELETTYYVPHVFQSVSKNSQFAIKSGIFNLPLILLSQYHVGLRVVYTYKQCQQTVFTNSLRTVQTSH
jgi:hypothetical protein